MLSGVHHVSVHGLDLEGARRLIEGRLGAGPPSIDEPAGHAGGPRRRVATFRMGSAFLEYMEPFDRIGWYYDFARRNGGSPSVSHVAWRMPGIEARRRELVTRGAHILEQELPVSPHGGYWILNVIPDAAAGGLWLQFAEDQASTPNAGIEHQVKHVHHVRYEVWGLNYMVDYLGAVFGVSPSDECMVEEEGLRTATFQFGETLAHFSEPARYVHPVSGLPMGRENRDGRVVGVGWEVIDLDQSMNELAARGVSFIQPGPIESPFGAYRVVDVAPVTSGGLSIRLCQNL